MVFLKHLPGILGLYLQYFYSIVFLFGLYLQYFYRICSWSIFYGIIFYCIYHGTVLTASNVNGSLSSIPRNLRMTQLVKSSKPAFMYTSSFWRLTPLHFSLTSSTNLKSRSFICWLSTKCLILPRNHHISYNYIFHIKQFWNCIQVQVNLNWKKFLLKKNPYDSFKQCFEQDDIYDPD